MRSSFIVHRFSLSLLRRRLRQFVLQRGDRVVHRIDGDVDRLHRGFHVRFVVALLRVLGLVDQLVAAHDNRSGALDGTNTWLLPPLIVPLRVGLPFAEEEGLSGVVVPLATQGEPMIGSTDLGDVSWVVPTVQARVATHAIGTPGHSWQVTAQGKMPAAHKGMVQAAKVMAASRSG